MSAPNEMKTAIQLYFDLMLVKKYKPIRHHVLAGLYRVYGEHTVDEAVNNLVDKELNR